jgi:hypothetical protein
MYSPEMMDIKKRGSFDNQMTVEEFKKLPPARVMMMNNGGMFCSSNTTNLIRQYKFTDSFYNSLKMDPSLKKEKDFYGLSLNILFEDTSKLALTLLVSSFNVLKHYVVYSGSTKYILKRTNQVERVKLKNSKAILRLTKYEAIISRREAQFIGLMLKVFDTSEKNLLFDCFLEKYKKNENVKNSFKNHRETVRWVIDKKFLIGAGTEKVETQKKEATKAATKLLALIGKKPTSLLHKKVEEPKKSPWLKWVCVIGGIGLIVFLFWFGGIMELLDNENKKNEEEEQEKNKKELSKELNQTDPQKI